MQNFDFYSGNTHTQQQPDFVMRDPEYFAHMARHQHKEGIKRRNNATRFLSLVLGLCIVSFTTGLVVGIKFSGGSDKEIVDPATRRAMSSIGSRVSAAGTHSSRQNTDASESITEPQQIQGNEQTSSSSNNTTTRSFPKEIYPYVIRIGHDFSEENSRHIADYLSSKGHTVIVSKHEDFFRIYTGPYKERSAAESALNIINGYQDNTYFHSALVLTR